MEEQKTSIPGPGISFVELLDDTIDLDQETKGSSEYFPLRPSSAGACARKLAYDLAEFKGLAKYKKEPMKANVVRLLDLGYGVEYSVFRQFEKCKEFKVKYKQQVVTLFELEKTEKDTNPILVEGSIDAIFIGDTWRSVVDIKSQKDRFSVAYQSKWDETLIKYDGMKSMTKISDNGWYVPDLDAFIDEVNDPFLSDNFLQLNSYLCTNFCRERGVTFGSIIKYCKNDSRMYEIRFAPSETLFSYVKEKFNAVNQAVNKEKNPDLIKREYVFGSMKCAFCPYKASCWPADDALKAYFKTFPKKKWPTDSDRIPQGGVIEELFGVYKSHEQSEWEKLKVEQTIIKVLLEAKVDKIKLANKDVYMLKSLKEGIVLRRTKL